MASEERGAGAGGNGKERVGEWVSECMEGSLFTSKTFFGTLHTGQIKSF
jgi:hypothetical protein